MRDRAIQRGSVDREWIQKTVRWMVEWVPDSDLTLIAAIGRIARGGPKHRSPRGSWIEHSVPSIFDGESRRIVFSDSGRSALGLARHLSGGAGAAAHVCHARRSGDRMPAHRDRTTDRRMLFTISRLLASPGIPTTRVTASNPTSASCLGDCSAGRTLVAIIASPASF